MEVPQLVELQSVNVNILLVLQDQTVKEVRNFTIVAFTHHAYCVFGLTGIIFEILSLDLYFFKL